MALTTEKPEREKVGFKLPHDLARDLRLEKIDSGEDMSDIVAEALRQVLPQRRLARESLLA